MPAWRPADQGGAELAGLEAGEPAGAPGERTEVL